MGHMKNKKKDETTTDIWIASKIVTKKETIKFKREHRCNKNPLISAV